MAEHLIRSETLDAIADAINAKTGGTDAMTPAEMVDLIESIKTGGLPEYVSKLITGEIILAENTTELTLTHNYGTQASFMFLWSNITFAEREFNRGATTNRGLSTGLPSNSKRPLIHTYVYINESSGNILAMSTSALNADNAQTKIVSKGGTLRALKTVDSAGTTEPVKYHYVIGWVKAVT